jgi:hypothetical protein
MRRHSRPALLATATALALAGLVCAGPSLAAGAASGRRAAVSRAPLWADRYVEGGFPAAAAASAGEVFVTGASGSHSGVRAYATEAYAAATGARLWSARYRGMGIRDSSAGAIAASPGGGAVFVTGRSIEGQAVEVGYATVGYDPATGAQLWVARYDGPADSAAIASSIAVSPDGSEVFVTGSTGILGGSLTDYLTIAYSARTGARLWLRRYSGAGQADSIAVNPDGGEVYVTGYGPQGTDGTAYVTIAYGTATGARLWAARYSGPANAYDEARQVAVSHNGREVAVAGSSEGASGVSYATVAYSTTNGALLWARRYSVANSSDPAVSLAFSSGGKLFVTGGSGFFAGSAYATVAYTAAHGRQIWASRYSTPGGQTSGAVGVAVALSGGQVYVTGTADGGRRGINTIAYNAASGKADWVSRYPPPGHSTAIATAIAVDRDFVFVIGHTGTGGGYITLAYPALHHG